MSVAAAMHFNGLDGMRYLGADPARAADDVERMVMLKLNKRVVGLANQT